MKRVGFVLFCHAILIGFSGLTAHSEEVRFPQPGSAERSDIMDGLRDWVRTNYQVEAIFVVDALMVKDGYSWTTVKPQSPDGNSQYEPISAALHKEGGSWRVVFVDTFVEKLVDSNMSEFEARQQANADLLRQVPNFPRDMVPQ